MYIFNSPIGALSIFASPAGVTNLRFGEHSFATIGNNETNTDIQSQTILEQCAQELQEYFAGTRTQFSVPTDIKFKSDFQKQVSQATQAIPFGGTIAYKAIAVGLGSTNFSRAVGTACRMNPVPILIPCHRVLPTNGGIGQYLGGADAKAYLLELESSQ